MDYKIRSPFYSSNSKEVIQLVIYNERLLKFQGYNEGSFYILRPADIKIFRETPYEELDKVFSFRKNTKDTFLYEKRVTDGNYIILRRNDFFALKKATIDNKLDYGRTMQKAKELNFYKTIDFVRVNTIYIIGKYIQERFLQSENINLPEKAQVENEYIDMYIKITPFFKIFNEIKIYSFSGEYYLYCKVSNDTTKFELVFDTDTLKDLFRKYQNPDYEPFSIEEAKSCNTLKVMDEQEEKTYKVEKELDDIAALLGNIEEISKSTSLEEAFPSVEDLVPDDDFDDLEEFASDLAAPTDFSML